MIPLPRSKGVDIDLTSYAVYTDGSGEVVSRNGQSEISGHYARMRHVSEEEAKELERLWEEDKEGFNENKFAKKIFKRPIDYRINGRFIVGLREHPEKKGEIDFIVSSSPVEQSD